MSVAAGRPSRSRRRRLGAAVTVALAVGALAATGPGADAAQRSRGPSAAAPERTAARTAARTPASANPLAGRTWGVYRGAGDQVSGPYAASQGEERTLLATIAERPRAKWFGAWIPDSQVEGLVRSYVAETTGGDPEVMVQMAVFRVVPWEGQDRICDRLPTAAEQASYRAWMDGFAAGVGSAHAAIVMQPDGPFTLCAKGGSKIGSKLVRYGVEKLAALPNTSVYIDAGASDWNRSDPARALKMLLPAGIRSARGFAFNSTHYATTDAEVRYGAKVVKALAKRGVAGKHFVVNTSSNGRGFDGYTYKGPNFDNAKVCGSATAKKCVTLGIPPTTDVASPAWGLSAAGRRAAARYADAYLWFGRPWLYNQADPFDMQRALQLARTTPYPGPVPAPQPSATPAPTP